MKKLIVIAALIAGVGAAGAALAQSGPPYRMTLAGASAGGLWSALGVGVDQAVSAAHPGSTITYQTGGGGLANLPLVSKNAVPMGIALDTEVDIGLKGEEPYKEPIKNVRGLARLYDAQVNYMLVTKDFAEKHGIRSMSDLVQKKPPVRVAMNRRGNATGKISALFFESMGVTPQDIEKWGGQVIYAASAEQANLILDRRIDMIANGLFAPDRSILQITNSIDVVWLDTPEDVLKKVADQSAGFVTTVKAGVYPWLTKDVRTTAHGAVIVVNEAMDEATAYNLAKAIVVNIDKIRGQNKAMEALTPKIVATPSVIPFHLGAAKYYREAGLLK